MLAASLKYKLSKINLTPQIFDTPHSQHLKRTHDITFFKKIPSSSKRLKYSYKNSIFKTQTKNKDRVLTIQEHEPAFNEQHIINQNKLSAFKQDNSPNNPITRRKISICSNNPAASKQHQRTKTMNAESTQRNRLFIRQFSISRSIHYDQQTQREQSEQKTMLKNQCHKKSSFRTIQKDCSHFKQQGREGYRPKTAINQSIGLNPYTKQQYIHERNKNKDEANKIKYQSKINHPTSIVKSYQIVTLQLADPLQRYSKKPIQNNTLPECYFDVQNQENLREILQSDLQKLEVAKVNKQKRNNTKRSSRSNEKNMNLSTQWYAPQQNIQPTPWQTEDIADSMLQRTQQF